MAWARWAAFLAIAAAGCGGARSSPGNVGTTRVAGTCTVASRWTSGQLLAPGGGFRYAAVLDADATIDLSDAAPRAHVEVDGFVLEGTIDPTDALRVVPPTAMGETVLLPPGAGVSWLGTEGDRARIGLGRFALDENDGISWVEAPSTVVPCSALGLSFAYRDEDSERRERLALGLPLDPPVRWLPAGRTIALAGHEGGPAALTLTADEVSLALLVIEDHGTRVRVAQQHWTGATLVGWTDASGLVLEEPVREGYGVGGVLGALAGGGTYESCVASVPLAVSARQLAVRDADGNSVPLETPGAPISVGTLAAGARFVRLEARADGTMRIAPHPQGHLAALGEAEWLAPAVEATCTTEQVPDPSTVLQ